jgi:hypothetical protein
MHAFPPEVMHESSLFLGEMPANHRQVLPYRSMREKLPYQHVSIRLSLGKQKNAGRETINPMNDQSSLSLSLQVR